MLINAGFAARHLTPDVGVPLSGYGDRQRRSLPFNTDRRYPAATLFKPSTGVLDPIRAKAFVLERDGRKLLFLSLDVVGVAADLYRRIVRRLAPLGFDASSTFVSATHTHSGPGTLSRNLLWQVLMTDVFQPAISERFVTGVVDAVREADAARQPATLHAVAFVAQGLQRNRRYATGFFDPTANVLLARGADTGTPLGAMVNLAIHGTALQADNLAFSADVPGGIERALEERLGAPVLFVNGAVGDVSPISVGPAGIDVIGRSFAEQAMAAVPAARPIDPRWSVQWKNVRLPPPRMNPRDMGRARRLGVSVALRVSLPRAMPLAVVRLGDMTFLAWPGEPTTSLGITLKDAARQAGAAQAWVLGLTNGYYGYFVTPEEYRAGGYEASASFYGADAGTRLVAEFRSMSRGS